MGCVFVFEPTPGVLINGAASYVLPEGTVTFKKQSNGRVQFAAHHSIIDYVLVGVAAASPHWGR